MNNALPTYSRSVNTIISTQKSLLIGAGANGTFYRYDSAAGQWREEYYHGKLSPGLQVDKLWFETNAVFAVSGFMVLRSNDDGATWRDDGAHTPSGLHRILHSGRNDHYLITNLLDGNAWLQRRDKLVSEGSPWSVREDRIPGFVYDVLEHSNHLFLAKEAGLYVRTIVTGTPPPIDTEAMITIYLS